MTDKLKTAPSNGTDVQITAEGILVPLGKDWPGEYITFEREWTFGDIDSLGGYIAGTAPSIIMVIRKTRDWKLKIGENWIVFDREALLKDHSSLFGLPSPKARAVSMAAYNAYAESSKPSPLVNS